MRVHWLAPYQLRSLDDINHANIASIRLRAGVLRTVAGRSISLSVGDSMPAESGVDVLIIGKLSVRDNPERPAKWLRACEEIKVSGGKIVLDYTENILGLGGKRASFYRHILPMVDLAVCSSPWLKDSLEPYFPGCGVVIEDPIEVEVQPPRDTSHHPVTALWFGHGTNLPYLANLISNWPEKHIQTKLLVLTNDTGLEWLKRQGVKKPPNLSLEVYLWSVPTMLAAARDSDLCLIPADPFNPAKAGVSSNRLVTSLALGLPTAANVVDSYQEFRDYFVDIGSDEFIAMLSDPCACIDSVKEAQLTVVPRFNRESIGGKWLEALERL